MGIRKREQEFLKIADEMGRFVNLSCLIGFMCINLIYIEYNLKYANFIHMPSNGRKIRYWCSWILKIV